MTDSSIDQLLARELASIEPLPPGDCVVYGAGNVGRQVARLLADSGRTVRAFIDQKAQGPIVGLDVYRPDSEQVRSWVAEGLPVFIGVFNYTDPWAIVSLLQELGFQRVVTFHELHEHFDLPPNFWLTKRNFALERKDRVRAGWALLADETSRQVYEDAIRLRLTKDLRLMREPTAGAQYLPPGLPRPRTPLRMIDGGAFDGDTLAAFLDQGLSFDAVAAFEPDLDNFRKLRETIGQHAAQLGDATLWPCGVSDQTCVATFHSGQGTGSAIGADGNVHIQLVALDDALPSFAPNYLKFDIEGAELAALRGGAKMIRQFQPSLAVCVYHCPDHLWEIPLYIRELLPDHRIALRYHSYQSFELVAYAFPPG